jgi:hypothetical protein
MWLWDSFLQPMCESHRQDADLDHHPLALTRSACGPCQARVGVQVLDRATGERLWEHSWQSAGHQVDWAVALDFARSDLQGAAAVCGQVLITGEGDTLCGRSLDDGALLWSTPVPHLTEGNCRSSVVAPELGVHSTWLPLTTNRSRTNLLVHGATGRIVRVDGWLWAVIDDTVLVRDEQHVRGLRLPTPATG